MTSSLTTQPGLDRDGIRPVTKALVGGLPVDGRAGTFEVTSPQDGTLIGLVAHSNEADVDDAVRAARAAQPAWAATPLIERVKILRRVHALFAERAEPVAMMLVREIGKTLEEAREEVHEYAAPSWQ